jgi:HPt (histidine-containing phosphotransfer) domain-containing protein
LLEAASAARAASADDEVWRLAHRIQGTAGSYGLHALALELATIEALLERAHRSHAPATGDERARAAAALVRARATLA